MPNSEEYEARIGRILKGEIKRAGFTYAKLADDLNKRGIAEKEANVRNKVGRGKFSAAFLVQCMDAIGVSDLRL